MGDLIPYKYGTYDEIFKFNIEEDHRFQQPVVLSDDHRSDNTRRLDVLVFDGGLDLTFGYRDLRLIYDSRCLVVNDFIDLGITSPAVVSQVPRPDPGKCVLERLTDLNYQPHFLISMAMVQTRRYKLLPKALSWVYGIAPEGHFVRTSPKDKTKVVYNDHKGREVTISLGKYLKKFANNSYVNLTDKEVQGYAQDYAALMAIEIKAYAEKFKVGTSPEEFVAAYNSDIPSCMQGKKLDKHNLEYHPAETYASGDFEIHTYVERGTILARSIVSSKNKAFWSVYPKDDSDTPKTEAAKALLAHLLTQGFSRSRDWAENCKVVCNEYEATDGNDNVILPYVDKATRFCAKFRGGEIEYFMIDPDDETSDELDLEPFADTGDAYNNNWAFTLHGDSGAGAATECDDCGDSYDENEGHYVIDGHGNSITVCEGCRDENYSWVPEDGEVIASDDAVWSNHQDAYLNRNNAEYIEYLSDWIRRVDSVELDVSLVATGSMALSDDTIEDYQGMVILISESVILYDEGIAHRDDEDLVPLFNDEYAISGDEGLRSFSPHSVYSNQAFILAGIEYDLIHLVDGGYAHRDDVQDVVEIASGENQGFMCFSEDLWIYEEEESEDDIPSGILINNDTNSDESEGIET